MTGMISHRRYEVWLQILIVMIVGLMALGAGVRAMNAGLSCPDWPLCFGQVIPDYHPAVWFEFVHRAYAGLVAIVFFLCAFYGFKKNDIPGGVKSAARWGIFFLILQIVMGALTVRYQVRSYVVTGHLTIATLFFLSVYWMVMSIDERVDRPHAYLPGSFAGVVRLLPLLVFIQIVVGGFVASTYAGSVCVDWPLCNGEWVPTWAGSIGIQIAHRFLAYGLAATIVIFAVMMQYKHMQPWVTPQFLRLSRYAAFTVFAQVVVGILNLIMYIPPWLTVMHQSIAIILFAITVRLYFVVRRIRG